VGANGQLFTQPYVILTVNKLRVAVIGAMTDTLRDLSEAQLLGEWHTLPVVATARKYAAELRAKSDLVVLLGHITGRKKRSF
jgi:2',3'-cyclic-nucleotide 2'-phosphodiesterase (5'-nucleotidase family)